jgi:hypothetical protein
MSAVDLQGLMLSQLAGGNGGGLPPLSLPALVEQSLGDDPLAAPLAAMLREREAAAAEEPLEDELASDPQTADVLARLYDEVEQLRARFQALADALGACPRCFGEDVLCPVCRGRGRPGGRSPDPMRFAELVEPALRRRIRDGTARPAELAAADNCPPLPAGSTDPEI